MKRPSKAISKEWRELLETNVLEWVSGRKTKLKDVIIDPTIDDSYEGVERMWVIMETQKEHTCKVCNRVGKPKTKEYTLSIEGGKRQVKGHCSSCGAYIMHYTAYPNPDMVIPEGRYKGETYREVAKKDIAYLEELSQKKSVIENHPYVRLACLSAIEERKIDLTSGF